ncbi:MAG: hypothetical protein LBL41_04455 [Bifidobacteriaceae bacterium]|jgi:hypothetical protein|nr:hypothetical protein [Bifidobacteriaceae bacterium]
MLNLELIFCTITAEEDCIITYTITEGLTTETAYAVRGNNEKVVEPKTYGVEEFTLSIYEHIDDGKAKKIASSKVKLPFEDALYILDLVRSGDLKSAKRYVVKHEISKDGFDMISELSMPLESISFLAIFDQFNRVYDAKFWIVSAEKNRYALELEPFFSNDIINNTAEIAISPLGDDAVIEMASDIFARMQTLAASTDFHAEFENARSQAREMESFTSLYDAYDDYYEKRNASGDYQTPKAEFDEDHDDDFFREKIEKDGVMTPLTFEYSKYDSLTLLILALEKLDSEKDMDKLEELFEKEITFNQRSDYVTLRLDEILSEGKMFGETTKEIMHHVKQRLSSLNKRNRFYDAAALLEVDYASRDITVGSLKSIPIALKAAIPEEQRNETVVYDAAVVEKTSFENAMFLILTLNTAANSVYDEEVYNIR